MPPPGETRKEGVNVQVLLRCRPPTDAELYNQVITCNEHLREVTLTQKASNMSRTFHYDKVFGPDCSQDRLFQQAVVPLVIEVLDGFNCTIFAYGQTGTGKTYTMEGGPRKSVDGTNLSAEAGVIPRCIKYIFDTIEANNSDTTVKVSFLELYNEELTDLLAFDDSKKLRLMEDRDGVVVKGIEEITVKTATDIYQVLDRGSLRRRTAETLLNKRSSRSHSLFTITIVVNTRTAEGEGLVKIGKLNLVDLAGSENISRSGAKDDRAREAGSINQSLLTLGRVINALVDHSVHIPYRDSKLTRLLRDSLGGRTKTCIIATIAPSVHCQEETISTLDYAHRAKNIRNRPEVNQKISQGVMIKELMTTIDSLKMELIATREKNGVYMPVEQHEEKEKELQHLRGRLQQLQSSTAAQAAQAEEQMLAMKQKYESQIQELQSRLQSTADELSKTQEQLVEANRGIHEREYIISAYQKSEQAVAQHAASLTMSLADTTGNLTQLHDKFDELGEVHKKDRHVMTKLADIVDSKMTKLHAAVTNMVHAQQQSQLVVERQVADIQHNISVMQVTVSERLQHLHCAAETMHECMQQHVGGVAAHGMGHADTVQAAAQSFASQLNSMVDTAQQAASTASHAVLTAVTQQRQHLQQLLLTQQESQAALVGSARQMLGQAQDALNHVACAANAAHEDAEKALGEQLSAQQQVMGALHGQLDEKKEELVKQVTALMEAFMVDSRQTLATASSDLASQTQALQQKLGASLQSIPDAASAASAALQNGSQALADTSAKIDTRMQDGGRELLASMDSCTMQLERAAAESKSAATEQHSLLTSYVMTMEQQRAQFSASSQQLVESSHTEGASALQGLEQAVSQTQSALEVATNTQAALHEAMMANVGQSLEALSTACAEKQTALQNVANQVRKKVEKQLKSVVDVENIPPRQSGKVPDVSVIKEAQCPPRGVLLEKLSQTFRDSTQQLPTEDVQSENYRSPFKATPVPGKLNHNPSRIPNFGATPVDINRGSKALADVTNWQQQQLTPMQE